MVRSHLKGLALSILLLGLSACASSQQVVNFTPSKPDAEVFAKIKKDIIDASIQHGNSIGYAPLNYNYDNCTLQMQKFVITDLWTVNVTCVQVGQKITATIYSPDRAGNQAGGGAHDVDSFHAKLMKLYK